MGRELQGEPIPSAMLIVLSPEPQQLPEIDQKIFPSAPARLIPFLFQYIPTPSTQQMTASTMPMRIFPFRYLLTLPPL